MQLIRPVTAGDEYVKTLPGITAPFGFFDPLKLTPEDPADVLLWREAELQHGRVAMMAATGFLVQESGFHPLFPEVSGPAAFQLDQIPSSEQGITRCFETYAHWPPLFLLLTYGTPSFW